jgi:hypothetical protein
MRIDLFLINDTRNELQLLEGFCIENLIEDFILKANRGDFFQSITIADIKVDAEESTISF